MKTQPELCVVFGYFRQQLSREDAAEILRRTRWVNKVAGCPNRFLRQRGVYQLGGLFLYTQLEGGAL